MDEREQADLAGAALGASATNQGVVLSEDEAKAKILSMIGQPAPAPTPEVTQEQGDDVRRLLDILGKYSGQIKEKASEAYAGARKSIGENLSLSDPSINDAIAGMRNAATSIEKWDKPTAAAVEQPVQKGKVTFANSSQPESSTSASLSSIMPQVGTPSVVAPDLQAELSAIGAKANAYEVAAQLEKDKFEQDRARGLAQVEKLQSAVDQLSSSKFDPNRFWNNLGTPAKVVAGISMVLSQLGGGRGAAIIDKAIKDDIEAQKIDFDRNKSVVEGQNSVFSQFNAMTRNSNDASQLALAAAYNRAALSVQQFEAKTQSEEAKLRAQDLQSKLQAQSQEYFKNALSHVTDMNTTEEIATKGYAVLSSPEDRVRYFAANPKAKELIVKNIGVANSEKEKQEITTALSSHEKMAEVIKRITALQESVGREGLSTEARARANSLGLEFANTWKQASQSGAWDTGLVNLFSRAYNLSPLDSSSKFDVGAIGARIGDVILGKERMGAGYNEYLSLANKAMESYVGNKVQVRFPGFNQVLGKSSVKDRLKEVK